MKKGIILLALALAVLLPRTDALALTLSPPRWEVAADVGSNVGGEIIIINDQNETKTFYSSFENFEAQGDTGTPRFTGNTGGLASWITTEPSVTVKPGESKIVPFSIKIPSTAEEQGYFAAIFWGTTPPGSEDMGQVAVGAKVGTLLLVTVGSNINESAGLLNFNTANKKFFYKSLPVTFEYRFTNSGGDRVRPEGIITVRSILGWRVARVNANPFDGNILPKTTRKFSPEWTKLPPDERPSAEEQQAPYSFFKAVKNEWKNFAIGIFRSNMSLQYGHTDQQVQSRSVYFIVFPLELIGLILLGVFLIFFILWRSIRRYNRWVIGKAEVRIASLQQKKLE